MSLQDKPFFSLNFLYETIYCGYSNDYEEYCISKYFNGLNDKEKINVKKYKYEKLPHEVEANTLEENKI